MADINAVAKALNVTPRRVNQLANEGMPREGRGEYDLAACMLWYIRYLQKALSAKGSMDDDGQITTLKAERGRLVKMQADREELELARARGEVISLNDHERVLSDLVLETKARVMAVPARVAPQILGESSRVMAQARIEKGLREALTQLAGVAPRAPKPEEPKAKRKAAKSKGG